MASEVLDKIEVVSESNKVAVDLMSSAIDLESTGTLDLPVSKKVIHLSGSTAECKAKDVETDGTTAPIDVKEPTIDQYMENNQNSTFNGSDDIMNLDITSANALIEGEEMNAKALESNVEMTVVNESAPVVKRVTESLPDNVVRIEGILYEIIKFLIAMNSALMMMMIENPITTKKSKQKKKTNMKIKLNYQ